MASSNAAKLRTYWIIVAAVVLADMVTKALAEAMLYPRGVPREVVGEWLRLTLVYNRGAAFGLHLGQHSRWIFIALTVVALWILWRLLQETRAGDRLRLVAISLVSGGALGNFIDRVRHAQGVVDFIDVGVGNLRWPTFNVADMAVSTGAVLLAWVLWGEDRRERASSVVAPETSRAP